MEKSEVERLRAEWREAELAMIQSNAANYDRAEKAEREVAALRERLKMRFPDDQAKTAHAGNVGKSRTPFYTFSGQEEPEYDQGDSVVVWYDDLYNLADERDKAEAELAVLREENAKRIVLYNQLLTVYETERSRAESAEARVTALEAALKDLLDVIAADELIPETVSYMRQARAALTGKEDAQHG